MALTQSKKGVMRNLEGLLEKERRCEEKAILSSGRDRWNMSSAGIRLQVQSQLSDQVRCVDKMIRRCENCSNWQQQESDGKVDLLVLQG